MLKLVALGNVGHLVQQEVSLLGASEMSKAGRKQDGRTQKAKRQRPIAVLADAEANVPSRNGIQKSRFGRNGADNQTVNEQMPQQCIERAAKQAANIDRGKDQRPVVWR